MTELINVKQIGDSLSRPEGIDALISKVRNVSFGSTDNPQEIIEYLYTTLLALKFRGVGNHDLATDLSTLFSTIFLSESGFVFTPDYATKLWTKFTEVYGIESKWARLILEFASQVHENRGSNRELAVATELSYSSVKNYLSDIYEQIASLHPDFPCTRTALAALCSNWVFDKVKRSVEA